MDEKIFNLLEKVYVELQGNTQQLNALEVEVKEVKAEVKENSQRLNALEVKVNGLEAEVKDNSLRLNRLEKEVTCTNKQFVQLEIAFVQLEKTSNTNSNHIILLENELHDKVGILFDGLEAVKQDINDMKKTLCEFTEKFETLDSRISIAEKKLNFLSCQI